MIERLFPRKMFPETMFDDAYWLGLVSGLVVGGLYALVGAGMLVVAFGIVITLKLIVWRVDANTEPREADPEP